ncbi:MAG: hypothetical protein HQM13_05585 [SAR324 cluster bacterium]|nr:hypothetical protein [SAR324 cluster bacterium]
MDQKSNASVDGKAENDAVFVGEEGDDNPSTPARDFASSIVIAFVAILAIVLSLQMHNPDTLFTAPGLLPFLIGLTLLIMAISLAFKAIKQNGPQYLIQELNKGTPRFFKNEENLRTLLLILIVIVYVTLTISISFDLRLPTDFFVFQFSSYELLSIITLTLILRIFWRASLLRCLLVSTLWSIALASVFRYGFHILLPGSG